MLGVAGDDLYTPGFGDYLPQFPAGDTGHLRNNEVLAADGVTREHVCPGEPGLVDTVCDGRDRLLTGAACHALSDVARLDSQVGCVESLGELCLGHVVRVQLDSVGLGTHTDVYLVDAEFVGDGPLDLETAPRPQTNSFGGQPLQCPADARTTGQFQPVLEIRRVAERCPVEVCT